MKDNSDTIAEGLIDAYQKYVLPLERDFQFSQFYSPELTVGDFRTKPIILLMGQYSTGKTSFIKHMLGREYPGLRIGPEPSTEKFVAVCGASPDQKVGQVLLGRAAASDTAFPWSQLSGFGEAFLSRFEVVHVQNSKFAGSIFVDTPGILSANKSWNQGYDFEGVIQWFTERVDLVLLFFDAYKLDIGDEFKKCIRALRGHESKVCILLNKADSVTPHELMRVYGALMWCLGKVIEAPEVPRIYVGSFWGGMRQNADGQELFEKEEQDLLNLIHSLPARSAARKIEDFLKRFRMCRTHAIVMNHLRKQLPLIGKSYKHKSMCANLQEILDAFQKERGIPAADFPDVNKLQAKLGKLLEFPKFPKLDMKKIDAVRQAVDKEVAQLTKKIRDEEVRHQTTEAIDVHCVDMPGHYRPQQELDPTTPPPLHKPVYRTTTQEVTTCPMEWNELYVPPEDR